jgi:hypothetical protein
MFQDKDLLKHIETSSSIKTQSAVIAEWNMNIYSNILAVGNYRYRPNDPDSIYRTIPNTFLLEDKNSIPAFYYGATDADVVVDGGFDNNDLPFKLVPKKDKLKMLYSLEDCLKPFRPRSGINKAVFKSGTFLHNPDINMARKPRYYMADKNDPFKYWTSFRTEYGIEYGTSNKTINGRHAIEDAVPFVVYKEKVPANRLIVKMQTNTGDIDSGRYTNKSGSFIDPYFGELNQTVPSVWKVQVLKNNNWVDAVSFTDQDKRKDGTSIIQSDGYVELAYGLILPKIYSEVFVYRGELSSITLRPPVGTREGDAYLIVENTGDIGEYHIWYQSEWKIFVPEYGWKFEEPVVDSFTNFVTELTSPTSYTVRGEKKYKEFEYISGIRIVVDSMKKFDSSFDLIEFSARLTVDLSDRVTAFSLNKSASDLGVSGMPVGQLLASTGSLSMFDFDDAFNKNNILRTENGKEYGSIVANQNVKNIQIKLYEILTDAIGIDYYVPLKTMYSDGFPKVNNQSKEVSLELRDLYFYFESQTAPELLSTNTSVSAAVSLLLDSIGFSNYVFKRVDGESEMVIPYFFIPPDKSVAEILQQLAISTQTSMFFDEYNNFVMMSKDFIMPTVSQRSTDITFYGSMDSGQVDVVKNKDTKDKISNIIELTSQDSQVYNGGQISYTTRHIQRTIGTIKAAGMLEQERLYIYKPVLLWEVSGQESIKSINQEVENSSTYDLSAIPLNSYLPATVPTVSNGKIINNTMDLGEGIYYIGRYNGYFYANGEIIKFDAVQYNISGTGDVWINSKSEYDTYFSSLPFNGKIYPTGLVRIYAEPNYEEINGLSKLKNGEVAKHGRAQFGTSISEHNAGLSDHWSNNDNVRGVEMDSKYLFKFDQTLPKTTGNVAAGVNNTFATKTTRNGIIKNYFSSKYISESSVNRMLSTQSGTTQSSALVMNGGGFKTTDTPANFLSYVYKPLSNKFKHFGTRLRVIGRIEDNEKNGQTPVGPSELYSVQGKTADEKITIAGGGGGIAIMVDPKTNAGYYFEIIALDATKINDSARQNVHDVLFYKIEANKSTNTVPSAPAIPVTLYQGLANIIVDGGQFVGQYRRAAEQDPTVYDLSVEYQDIGSRRKFFLYLNDNLIATVFDESPLSVYNNLALFIRGTSRVMFENVYALANNYSQNTSFQLDTPISNVFGDSGISAEDSFRKYSVSGAVQASYLTGISSSQPPKFSMYFDEFGTIMREAASFNFRYDLAYPALYAQLSPTFNKLKTYAISGFRARSYGAEFLIFNTTDTILSLDSSSQSYLRIQGIAFTNQSTNNFTVDEYFSKNSNLSDPQFESTGLITAVNKVAKNYEDIKASRMLYGKKDFSLDVPYVQNADAAENLMSWLVKKITKPRKSIGLKIFANPMIQLGDIVQIDYNEKGIEKTGSADARYVVYNIEYSKTKDGPEMSVFLSEVL